MSNRLVRVGTALALAILPSVVWGSEDGRPRIEEVTLERDGPRLQVAFRLIEALGTDVVERIESGLEVTYRHRVEVLARRKVPLWPSRKVATAVVDATVRYDSLTRRYELTRLVTLNDQDGKRVADERRQSVESLDEVEDWMTRFDDLPALDLTDAPAEARMRVRIESTLGRRYVMGFIPVRRTTELEKRLPR